MSEEKVEGQDGVQTQAPQATETPEISTPKSDTVKKSRPKVKKVKPVSAIQAATLAWKDDKVVDADPSFYLPVLMIIDNQNPRHEPENLYNLGYILIGKHPTWIPENGEERLSLLEMALSDDLDLVRKFVALIEAHENVNRKKSPDVPQSIVELAGDIEVLTQLVPVAVRAQPKGFSLLDGGRRLTAILYNHAKGRVNKADKVEGAKVPPPVVKAIETKIGKNDVFAASVLLNLSRKQFTPLQEGFVYHQLLQQKNQETGRRYTLDEVSELVKVPKGTIRNRSSLFRPFVPAVRDSKTGEVVTPARGLTDGDRRKLAEGSITLTAATRKALGERHYSETGAPKTDRAKPRSIAELRERFDATAERKNEIREVLAWAMGLTLPQAVKESEHRIANEEIADVGRRKKE